MFNIYKIMIYEKQGNIICKVPEIELQTIL